MACEPRDGDTFVGPDHQAPRRKRRRLEMSAAERRRERDLRIMWCFDHGATEDDVVILTGLSLKQVRNRVQAMAEAERATRYGE